LRSAELEQGVNLYSYVQNNPINFVDRLGLCCEAEWDEVKNLLNELNSPKQRNLEETLRDNCEAYHTAPEDIAKCYRDVDQWIDELEQMLIHKMRLYRKCMAKPCNNGCEMQRGFCLYSYPRGVRVKKCY
jgi:hypothetical protein